MMRISTISFGFALAIGLGAAAAAEPIGEVVVVEGLALKSDGARFIEIREGMALRQLDRLMTTEGSTAMLAFNDGCRYEMSELELLTLTDKSACQSAAALSERQSASLARAKASSATSSMQSIEQAVTSTLPGAASASMNLSWLPAAFAGVVAGTAVGDTNLNDRSSDRSSYLSP